MEENNYFLGRELELEKIFHGLKRGKHVLILGDKGCGKTALVNEFVKESNRTNPQQGILVSAQSTSLKDTCIQLAGCLYRLRIPMKIPDSMKIMNPDLPWEKASPFFGELRTTVLKNIIFNTIRGKNLIIVLDHLGKMKLKFFLFLDSLRDHVKLILIARNTHRKEMGRLWMLLWGFEKIELRPLSLKEQKVLVSHWLGGENHGHSNRKKWFDELLHIADGNPEILKNLCEQIRKQNLIAGKTVNIQIADIDRKIAELLKSD